MNTQPAHESVLHYTDIPLISRDILSHRVYKRDYDEMVEIMGGRIYGSSTGVEYTGLRDMHYGAGKWCVGRVELPPITDGEKGFVYCSPTGECVVDWFICHNISRVDRPSEPHHLEAPSPVVAEAETPENLGEPEPAFADSVEPEILAYWIATDGELLREERWSYSGSYIGASAFPGIPGIQGACPTCNYCPPGVTPLPPVTPIPEPPTWYALLAGLALLTYRRLGARKKRYPVYDYLSKTRNLWSRTSKQFSPR